MASGVKRIPDGCRSVTPHLVVRDAARAIEFYKKAFGAKEIGRHTGPDGQRVMHAEIQIGDSRIYLNGCNHASSTKNRRKPQFSAA
jgi:PhnB protein